MATGISTGRRDYGLLLSGIALILIAFAIMLWPGATLVTIAIITGVVLLLMGIVDIMSYSRIRNSTDRSGWMVVNAVLDIVLGGMFLLHPIITASALPWLAGVFIIAYGIMAVASAFAFRPMGPLWVAMLINGIVSVLIGIMFIANPAYFIYLLGIYLIVRGAVMCVSSLAAPRM